RRGLSYTRIASFGSVLFNADASQMASIKAVQAGAAEMLGGDLGIAGRDDPPQAFADEAQRRGLSYTRIASFGSVLFNADASQMASIKAVQAG
ncbi:hypothetical protein C7E19_24660, partial [Stenotrophomonas maltophilia]